jgi:hypothetical protein
MNYFRLLLIFLILHAEEKPTDITKQDLSVDSNESDFASSQINGTCDLSDFDSSSEFYSDEYSETQAPQELSKPHYISSETLKSHPVNLYAYPSYDKAESFRIFEECPRQRILTAVKKYKDAIDRNKHASFDVYLDNQEQLLNSLKHSEEKVIFQKNSLVTLGSEQVNLNAKKIFTKIKNKINIFIANIESLVTRIPLELVEIKKMLQNLSYLEQETDKSITQISSYIDDSTVTDYEKLLSKILPILDKVQEIHNIYKK